jgi:hypothetical protein
MHDHAYLQSKNNDIRPSSNPQLNFNNSSNSLNVESFEKHDNRASESDRNKKTMQMGSILLHNSNSIQLIGELYQNDSDICNILLILS